MLDRNRVVGKLEGRTAIVTGAGRGIGAATAAMLAAEGAQVVVNDRDRDVALAQAEVLRNSGANAHAIACDLTLPDSPDALVAETLDVYGAIDIVVNNAGYVWNGAMHNHTDEQWQAMLDMHATVPFRVLRAMAPWLKGQATMERERDGAPMCRKVVNISSVSGTEGAATQIAYSAGKAAVVGLTKTLAKEWGRYNVTVNCVAFGHIDTRLTQSYSDEPPTVQVGERHHKVGLSEAQVKAVQQATPLGRSGTPEDAAGAVMLFCLPESNFVSGQVLTCAGGG